MKIISNDGCDVFVSNEFRSIYIRKTDDFNDNHAMLKYALNELVDILERKTKQHGCTNFVSDRDNIGLKIIGEKINKYIMENR